MGIVRTAPGVCQVATFDTDTDPRYTYGTTARLFKCELGSRTQHEQPRHIRSSTRKERFMTRAVVRCLGVPFFVIYRGELMGTRPKELTERTAIRLPALLVERLDRKASALGLTRSQAARAALTWWVETEPTVIETEPPATA